MIGEALKHLPAPRRLCYKLKDSLYANAIHLIANHAVMAFFGFFFWMAVARFYAPVAVGYGSAIISALSLLAALSLLGLNVSLVRFLPGAAQPSAMINTSLAVSGIAAVAMATVFLAGIELWSPALSFVREQPPFAVAFVLLAAVYAAGHVVDAAFVAGRRAKLVLLKNGLYSVLKIPLAIVLSFSLRAFGVVAAWGVAHVVPIGLALVAFLPRLYPGYRPLPAVSTGLVTQMWRYSAANHLADLLSTAPAFVLPLIVVNLVSAEHNAYFYVTWTIASMLFAVAGAATRSLLAETSHQHTRLRDFTSRTIVFIMGLLVPGVLVLLVAGKWLLMAFGEAYASNGLALLRILAVSSLPFAVNQVYSMLLRITHRLVELEVLWGLIAGTTLAASYVTAPRLGLEAIGYSWLAVHTAVAGWVLVGRRLTGAYRIRTPGDRTNEELKNSPSCSLGKEGGK